MAAVDRVVHMVHLPSYTPVTSQDRLNAMSHSWELVGPNGAEGWYDWRCSACSQEEHSLFGEDNHPHFIRGTGDCATQLVESIMKV